MADDGGNRLMADKAGKKKSSEAEALSATEQAFSALGKAVLAYVKEPRRLKEKRARAVDVSEWLRNAFSLRPETLDHLPKQLGANHLEAGDYLAEQLDHWAAQDAYYSLFSNLELDDTYAEQISQAIISSIQLDELAVWMCDEFGDLTATRRADHSRRYIATRLTREIVDLPKYQSENASFRPDQLQGRLNDWSNPAGSLETSLHFTMVIEPFLNAFETLAGGRRLF